MRRPSLNLVEVDGFWWPERAASYCRRYINKTKDMNTALGHCRKRDVVIQAGGHCGIWPLWLSQRFSRVYTFEPDFENFACLGLNASCSNIHATRGLLGNSLGPLELKVNQKNIGGHRGTPEPGDTLVYRVDNLHLDQCDAIILDVEGMELPVLEGAISTLSMFRPVLMIEDKDHGRRFGWSTRDELMFFLTRLGYREVARVSHDVVLTW